MPAERLRLTIAYEGTSWQGWQGQPNGLGIQNQLENALAVVTKQNVSVQGAGRTDTGVHALAMTAHFDCPEGLQIASAGWVRALNANLPPSIRVLICEPTHEGFHSRFDASGKIYRYRICREDILPPLEVNRAWHVYGPLDLKALNLCLSTLCGTHNFARLSANRGFPGEAELRADPANTTRTIHRATATEHDQFLTIEIEGNGFLYKMVRLIVGAAAHVARGRAPVSWFEDLLMNPAGPKNNQCAIAGGLYLVRVLYPDPNS